MYLRLSIAISVALLIVAISYSIASFIAVYKVKNEIKSSWAFDNLEVRVSWPSWNFVESKIVLICDLESDIPIKDITGVYYLFENRAFLSGLQ